jgi:hypothetical protein
MASIRKILFGNERAEGSGRDEPDGEPAAEEDGKGEAGEEGVERGVRGGGVHGSGPRQPKCGGQRHVMRYYYRTSSKKSGNATSLFSTSAKMRGEMRALEKPRNRKAAQGRAEGTPLNCR